MKITVLKTDITSLDVDAIVNAANSHGILGGGVAGAIKRKGGKEIEDEARAKAPTPVGKAICTTAGRLPCKAVIHAPTMREPASPSTPQNIMAATMAALSVAGEQGYRRIAIPGLGTGVGGVIPCDAALSIVHAVMSFADDAFDEIMLVDINDEMVKAFKDALAKEG